LPPRTRPPVQPRKRCRWPPELSARCSRPTMRTIPPRGLTTAPAPPPSPRGASRAAHIAQDARPFPPAGVAALPREHLIEMRVPLPAEDLPRPRVGEAAHGAGTIGHAAPRAGWGRERLGHAGQRPARERAARPASLYGRGGVPSRGGGGGWPAARRG